MSGSGGLDQLSFFRDARQKKLLELAGFGGLSVDGAANIYSVEMSSEGQSKLAKYDRLGQPAWQRQLGKIQEKSNIGIIADPLDGVSTYTTRVSSTAGNDLDVEVMQYNSDGLEKWRNVISSPMDEVATGSSIDNNRNLLVTGFTLGNIENYVAASSECAITDLGSNTQFIVNEDSVSNKKLCNKSWSTDCSSATYSIKTSDNQSTHGKPLHNITFFENSSYKYMNIKLPVSYTHLTLPTKRIV